MKVKLNALASVLSNSEPKSFKEIVSEAVPTGPTGTSGFDSKLASPEYSSDPNDEMIKVLDTFGSETELEMPDGSVQTIPDDSLDNQFNNELADGDSFSLTDFLSKTAGNATSSFKRGMGEELDELSKLAGLTEMSTAGSTSAGNISGLPSIVGATNDDAKPTSMLRKNERIKRDSRQAADEYKTKKQSDLGKPDTIIRRHNRQDFSNWENGGNVEVDMSDYYNKLNRD